MTKQAPRRRWQIKPWPWPGDSREDKAKRVAISYRQLAARSNGALQVALLDRHWALHGIYWQLPAPALDTTENDEWFTAAELAHYIHRTPPDIYRWAARGHIRKRSSADGSPEYSLKSAMLYEQQQRQRRAHMGIGTQDCITCSTCSTLHIYCAPLP